MEKDYAWMVCTWVLDVSDHLFIRSKFLVGPPPGPLNSDVELEGRQGRGKSR